MVPQLFTSLDLIFNANDFFENGHFWRFCQKSTYEFLRYLRILYKKNERKSVNISKIIGTDFFAIAEV